MPTIATTIILLTSLGQSGNVALREVLKNASIMKIMRVVDYYATTNLKEEHI